MGDLRRPDQFADKLRKLAADGYKRFDGFEYDVEADIQAYLVSGLGWTYVWRGAGCGCTGGGLWVPAEGTGHGRRSREGAAGPHGPPHAPLQAMAPTVLPYISDTVHQINEWCAVAWRGGEGQGGCMSAGASLVCTARRRRRCRRLHAHVVAGD